MLKTNEGLLHVQAYDDDDDDVFNKKQKLFWKY